VPHERQRTAGEDLNVLRERDVGQIHKSLAGAGVAVVIDGFVPRMGGEVVDLASEMQDGFSQSVILSAAVGVGDDDGPLRPAPSDLRFPSANSTPLRNRNFRRDSFDAATAALGLTITPHNLRDTASSLAIHAGASVVAVARLLGHESAATTLNHYAGLFPTDLDDSAVRLDAAPREAVGDQ